jgi:predicted regulator of Ras-like GTPase activity (Roadblock/LC7/MglB family)
MPYQKILDELVRSILGARGAMLLDANGERVVESGAKDHRDRLIGAYQGIGLSIAHKTTERYRMGRVAGIHCRYANGHVILRPLKDGYYLVLALEPGAPAGLAFTLSAAAAERLNEEL